MCLRVLEISLSTYKSQRYFVVAEQTHKNNGKAASAYKKRFLLIFSVSILIQITSKCYLHLANKLLRNLKCDTNAAKTCEHRHRLVKRHRHSHCSTNIIYIRKKRQQVKWRAFSASLRCQSSRRAFRFHRKWDKKNNEWLAVATMIFSKELGFIAKKSWKFKPYGAANEKSPWRQPCFLHEKWFVWHLFTLSIRKETKTCSRVAKPFHGQKRRSSASEKNITLYVKICLSSQNICLLCQFKSTLKLHFFVNFLQIMKTYYFVLIGFSFDSKTCLA